MCVAVLVLATACNAGVVLSDTDALVADRAVVSGGNGTVTVNGMENGNMTITYNAGSQKNFARLYVSEGNGVGLILNLLLQRHYSLYNQTNQHCLHLVY